LKLEIFILLPRILSQSVERALSLRSRATGWAANQQKRACHPACRIWTNKTSQAPRLVLLQASARARLQGQ